VRLSLTAHTQGLQCCWWKLWHINPAMTGHLISMFSTCQQRICKQGMLKPTYR